MIGPAHSDRKALEEIGRRVTGHAGLLPPGWVVEARVRERAATLGLEALDDYLSLLASAGGGAELDALAERLRVGETSFFRHHAHARALERVVAPDLAARRARDRRVRAWSAGCASGEEAYTLAIVLDAALPAERGFVVEVLGTDISEEALAAARRARYPATALRAVPPATRSRYFVPDGDGHQVAPWLAGRVRFERRNLLGPHFPTGQDVILCRNVLIYFDPAARVRTVERLIDSLAPGGYLFLGYAESLREFEALEALATEDGVIYRRPAQGAGATRAAARPPAGGRPGAAPAPAPGVTRRAPARPGATAAPTPPRTGGAGSATAPLAPARSARAPAPAVVVALRGTHESAEGVAAELRRAIASTGEGVVVDVSHADYLDDRIASVLHRAAAAAHAAGLGFRLTSTRPGPRRWLARHGLVGEER